MNREEVVRKATGLVAQGWQLLCGDDPDRGLVGFFACRYTLNGHPVEPPFKESDRVEEETQLLQWPLFDKALEPEEQVVGVDELISFIQDETNLAACDDPKRRLIGFVRYEPDKGKSTIRRTQLTQIREVDRQVYSDLMILRDRLLAERREASKSRLREVGVVEGS